MRRTPREQLKFVFIDAEDERTRRLTRELRERAHLQDNEIVLAPIIAERIMKLPIAIAPTLQTSACLARVGNDHQIFLREVGPDTNFDIAHELAHYALREIDKYVGPNEERLANQIAASLIAPDLVVQSIVDRHGDGLRGIRPLAKAVRISQTAAHFRLGEVIGDGRLVVTTRTNSLLVRTTGQIDWKTVPVNDIARGTIRRPGIARVELHGGIDEGRVALRAK